MVRFTEPLQVLSIFLIIAASGNKPVLDISNNMRLLLIPADTDVGSVIYRLRASDSDGDYPIKFRFYNVIGSTVSRIVEIGSVNCSRGDFCDADVLLRRSVSDPNRESYKFNLEVLDSREETTVVSTEIRVSKNKGPFNGAPKILYVSESASIGTSIHPFYVKMNPFTYRGVHCQLRPTSLYEYFDLGRGTRTRKEGESRCDLSLKKALDYETESSFLLRIIVENAWTDTDVDTRNIVEHDLIIRVKDVPDEPPMFTEFPPVVFIPGTAEENTTLSRVRAIDGDRETPRSIRYGLVEGSSDNNLPISINKNTGEIILNKKLNDLESPNSPIILKIFAEEVQDPDGNQENIQQVTGEMAIVIKDFVNGPPRFLSEKYVTYISENIDEGTRLVFDNGLDRVEDNDKGDNGKLALSIRGDYGDTFEISPSIIERSGEFMIRVKNNKKLNYEKLKNLEFQIIAEELGDARLSASASVLVHLTDINDNSPTFELKEYRISVPENPKIGTVFLRVKAYDVDEKENGRIIYGPINGDAIIKNSFGIDPKTGDIFVQDNKYIDREFQEQFTFTVEASNSNDRDGLKGETRVIIEIDDLNDNPPIFEKKRYQGFMNSGLDRLRNDLQVKAVDADASGTENSQIRYEIVKGNYYERRFHIDENTGVITVKEPLSSNKRGKLASLKKNSVELEEIDPVITLMVRAYDRGTPTLDSEVPVQIFTDEVFLRSMRFIIHEDQKFVQDHQSQISELISVMTGGDAEITNIQSYFGESVLAIEDAPSSAARVSRSDSSEKTSVDVFVRYPPNSVVDIRAVQARLFAQTSKDSENKNLHKLAFPINLPKTESGSRSTDTNGSVKELQDQNTALFWGLIVLCLLIALLIIIILLICCCCPGCYCYENNKLLPDTDFKVLSIKDSNGSSIKDTRFVRALRSARDRIRSRGSAQIEHMRIPSSNVLYGRNISSVPPNHLRGKRAADFDHNPNSYSGDHTYTLREDPPPHIVHRYPDDRYNAHSPEEVLYRGNDSRYYYGKRIPNDNGRIFKVIDSNDRRHARVDNDVQVLRLDDDAEDPRRQEMYRRLGNTEILSLDNHRDNVGGRENAIPDPSHYRGGRNSERSYFNRESPGSDIPERGFLNVAMSHLENQRQRGHNDYADDDESIPISNRSKTRSRTDYLDDHTPKHQINTPILEEEHENSLEEIESLGERRGSHEAVPNENPRFLFADDDGSISPVFRYIDGKVSPEFSYNETKSSILRRRNTVSKLLQEEENEQLERQRRESTTQRNRNLTRNRYSSLSDLTKPLKEHPRRFPERKVSEDTSSDFINGGSSLSVKRWNSISNDEMIRKNSTGKSPREIDDEDGKHRRNFSIYDPKTEE